MSNLAILQRVLREAQLSPAAPAPESPLVFPQDQLRFVLEYAATPEIETQRSQLAGLLGSDRFELSPLGKDRALSCFLVLRFPGVERVFQPRDLFGIAYDLADRLNLVSAEPDAGTGFYIDPETHPGDDHLEFATVLSPLCMAPGAPPPDRRWPLRSAGILGAWEKSKGAGILIGHPDTGIAAHAELDASVFDMSLAADILDGDADPTDPLLPDMANPGHGTGVASVIASPESGSIAGAAPQARIVPIRCIEDVKVFNTIPVAAAIGHAVQAQCHIVSLSLGGFAGRAMHAAIRSAIERDMIVIAAAGNCFPMVVWPAHYPEVIAVAGTNIEDQPWKGSSRGRAVDVAAPAEFVWRARRSRPVEPVTEVLAGQGTSFAAALVTGIAALWLSCFGRDAVVAQARARGITVQSLFRAALRATARKPAGWNADDLGAGIADAGALLALELANIPAAGPEAAAGGDHHMRQVLDDEMQPGVHDRQFPWPRYEAEISMILLAQARSGAPPAALSVESKSNATRPSEQLAKAVEQSSDPRLRQFGEQRGRTQLVRPLAFGGKEPAPARIGIALSRKAAGLRHEAAVIAPARAQDYLKGNGRAEQLRHLKQVLAKAGRAGGGLPDPGMRDSIMASAEEAFDHIVRGRRLSRTGLIGLETLVRLTGRPALRVRGSAVDLADPRAEDWRDRLFLVGQDADFTRHLDAVGRIDIDGIHVGTGYVVGDGIVLTNRHVLQVFAAPVPRRNNPSSWLLQSDDVTIDFAEEPSSATAKSRFRVLSVIGAGQKEILDDVINFACLDAALLAVEKTNADGTLLPQPADLLQGLANADRNRTVLVVGYPARPQSLPSGRDGEISLEVAARLSALFGADYGTKYLSPGEILQAPGQHAGDAARWTISHDATTLGGNSGSAVIGIDAPFGAMGLHFGGQWLTENYAHSLAALHAETDLFRLPALAWE
jgi:serine protease